MVLNQILGSNTKAPESQAQPDQGEADMEISSGSEDNDTNDQESQKTQPNQKTSRNASQLRSMQAHQLQEWAALQKANDEMDIPVSLMSPPFQQGFFFSSCLRMIFNVNMGLVLFYSLIHVNYSEYCNLKAQLFAYFHCIFFTHTIVMCMIILYHSGEWSWSFVS